MRVRNRRVKIWAYLDGKKLVEVIQAALDNNMPVDNSKLSQLNWSEHMTYNRKVGSSILPGSTIKRLWKVKGRK